MIISQILSKAYRLTNTDEITFLDGDTANILEELNVAYGNRTLDILRVRQDINQFIIEEKTDFFSSTGLPEGQIGYNGEYPFETTTMRPIRIEVSYDGITYRPCKVYDINENNGTEVGAADFNAGFSQTEPHVRFERNSYFIRPANESGETITDGIHIWIENRQSNLATESNETPDFENNLHNILAFDLADMERMMHPERYSDAWRNDFANSYARIEGRFNDFYKNRLKRNFVMKPTRESYK